MELPEYGDVLWIDSYDCTLEGMFAGVDTEYGTSLWKVRLPHELRYVDPKKCTIIKGRHAERIKHDLVKKEQSWADRHLFCWCHFVGSTGSPSCKQLAYSLIRTKS